MSEQSDLRKHASPAGLVTWTLNGKAINHPYIERTQNKSKEVM
jgi:hypothetical protein